MSPGGRDQVGVGLRPKREGRAGRGGPGRQLLPGAQGGRFLSAAFPGEVEVCSLRTAVRPGPEGVPTSDVPRAPAGASGAQSGGGPWSERALAEDRLDCAGSTGAFVCSLPPPAAGGRAGSPAVPGDPDPSVLTPAPGRREGASLRGPGCIPMSAPGDPRIRGSSSPGLRRRAMDVPGSERGPPPGHQSVPGREGLPQGTQAGALLIPPGLLRAGKRTGEPLDTAWLPGRKPG